MSEPTVGDEEHPAVEADRERAYGIGRLMAFSDGVLAIAITLLVLNLPVPNIAQADAEARLPGALLATGPRFLTFALSFFLVGFYWIRHHELFRQLVDVDVWLLWLNLVALFVVCLLPFTSGVVGRYFSTVVGAEVYAVNLAAIALSFTALNYSVTRRRLVRAPGAVSGMLSRGFVWPLVVVALVMVLAPIQLTVAYVLGASLMAAVSVYTAIPQVVRSAPLAALSDGRLRFGQMPARVNVTGESRMPQLFKARFVAAEPAVTVGGNTVDVDYRGVRRWKWRRYSAEITLNDSITWSVEAKEDIMNLTADLRGLKVTGVSVNGASYRVELRLPHPSGTVPIHLHRGVANLSIRRPPNVPLRATLPDGAASLHFDGQDMGPTLGRTPVESPGYADATDRYDLQIQGGAAKLTIGND